MLLSNKKSPEEQLLRYQLRFSLKILKPPKEKWSIVSRPHIRSVYIKWGGRVLSKNDGTVKKWKFGIVKEKLRNITYMIELDSGQVIKRHADQLQSTLVRKIVSFDTKPVIMNYYPRQQQVRRQSTNISKQRWNQSTSQQSLRRSTRNHWKLNRFGSDVPNM